MNALFFVYGPNFQISFIIPAGINISTKNNRSYIKISCLMVLHLAIRNKTKRCF